MTARRAAAAALLTVTAACGARRAMNGPSPEGSQRVEPPFVLEPMSWPERERLPFELGEEVVPLEYELEIALKPSSLAFTGVVKIDVEVREPVEVVWLHAAGLDELVAHITQAETRQAADVVRRGDVDLLGLRPPEPLVPGRAKVEVAYRGWYQKNFGVFQRLGVYVFTQFEPTHARRAFPCFDEPRFKVPWNLRLAVEPTYTALANTPSVGSKIVSSGLRQVVFAKTRPLPSYLVAFAAGPFDVVELPGAPVPMRAALRRIGAADSKAALEVAPRILDQVTRYFGSKVPYPKIDIVKVPEFRFGGMENPGLVFFSTQVMNTDSRWVRGWGARAFEHVAAHEFAHLWFGDLVTAPWWDDLWLGESLAEWLAGKSTLASELDRDGARGSSSRSGNDVIWSDSRTWAQPVRFAVRATEDFTVGTWRPDADSYEPLNRWSRRTSWDKGAAVVRMIEAWVGEAVFQRGIRDYMAKHADRTATALDLAESISRAARVDVRSVLMSYITLPGVPFVRARLDCRGREASVLVSQERHLVLGEDELGEQPPWSIPICVRHSGGRDCGVVSGRTGRVRLSTNRCPAWVHPNAEGTGYYLYGLPDRQLEALVANAAHLSTREIRNLVVNIVAGLDGGEIDAATALRALTGLARLSDPEVTIAVVDALSHVHATLVGPEERADFARFIETLYGKRGKATGLRPKERESLHGRKARVAVVALVGSVGEVADQLEETYRTAENWGAHADELDGMVRAALRIPRTRKLALAYYEQRYDDIKARMPIDELILEIGGVYRVGREPRLCSEDVAQELERFARPRLGDARYWAGGEESLRELLAVTLDEARHCRSIRAHHRESVRAFLARRSP